VIVHVLLLVSRAPVEIVHVDTFARGDHHIR
jgi:hypothetical protein